MSESLDRQPGISRGRAGLQGWLLAEGPMASPLGGYLSLHGAFYLT